MNLIWGANGNMQTCTPDTQITHPSFRAPQQYQQPPQYQQSPITYHNSVPLQILQGGGGGGGGVGNFQNLALFNVIKRLGQPSVTDPSTGGIAIWNASVLRNRGYPYLNRVEVLDEKIASVTPVPHISSVYIWIRIPLTLEQCQRIIELSPNFMYDQQRKMIIIRSRCLKTCISQAALIKLYSKGKLSIYQINNNNLLYKYFVNSKKHHKIFHKVLWSTKHRAR